MLLMFLRHAVLVRAFLILYMVLINIVLCFFVVLLYGD